MGHESGLRLSRYLLWIVYETSVQTGNNIYPISEQEEIVDVIIGPSKEKVTFNIDTELGKRDINFSRFHTNDNIVLETKQDEIVYLKIVLEKGTGKSKITYRAQPEKAKSINEIIVGGTNGKMLSFREEKMLNVTGRMDWER